MSCGLIACTSITFVIMFMPKGRQLSAMGKEGLYAEDRTEVYTGGSGTGSTGSSGTPSPSFFPVKPAKLAGNSHSHAASALEALKERERLDTPDSHRHLQSKFRNLLPLSSFNQNQFNMDYYFFVAQLLYNYSIVFNSL